jgi:hypothetical protein
MRDALKAAGNTASELVLYPDTPHAFHADYRPSYRKEQADDGWKRCLAWFGRRGLSMTLRMTLLYIVAATLVGGLLSVLIAAALNVVVLARLVRNLVSLSTGVLLGTALLQVLPEAFESKAEPHGCSPRCWAAAVLLPAGEGRALPPRPPPRG